MNKRVLIVDDNPVIAGLLSMSLAGAGYHVETAESGRQALAMVQACPPDLMLLDIDMPELSGLEVLAALKAQAVNLETPVLMLTGADDDWSVGQAHRMGASGYLLKPFDPDLLVRRVDRVLGDRDTLWIDDHHCLTRRRGRAHA